MNLLTFDEIIRLLRAKDLGLMTEDAVANQILKYREMENQNSTTIINSPISVTSSNEHSLQANDINEALLKIAAKYSKKVPTVEIGKEEFIRRLQEVDFNNIDTVKSKWEGKRRLVSKRACELIECDSNGKRLKEGLMNNNGSVE